MTARHVTDSVGVCAWLQDCFFLVKRRRDDQRERGASTAAGSDMKWEVFDKLSPPPCVRAIKRLISGQKTTKRQTDNLQRGRQRSGTK